jgi:TonB-dependent receptor
LDAAYDTELFDHSLTFTVGGLYTDRTKSRNVQQYSFTQANLTTAGLGTLTFDNAATNTIRNGQEYQGEYPLGYTFNYFSKDAIERLVNAAIRSGVAGPTAFGANEYYKVNEKILAGYGMAKVDFDWGNVVLGARVERTENAGLAFPILSSALGRARVAVTSEDTMVYPSMHVNVDVTDEWKMRVGLTTSASRPDFDDLRPNFSVDDANQTISGGNPEAGPEKQIGLDAYAEWYGEKGGYFSAGVFYKDISDVLFRTAAPFGITTLNTTSGAVTTDRSGYTFTTLRNGGDGYLLGAEFSLSHSFQDFVTRAGLGDWMGGFGVRASLTVTDSEVKVPAVRNRAGALVQPARKIPVLGTSDYVYNIQGIYEKYGLSVRLAYQFRTEWGQSVGNYTFLSNGFVVPDGNGDIYWDDDGELDLSIRYELTKNFELYADGSNLTNQGGRRYADKPEYPIEFEKFGPRYNVGVRFNF